MIFYRFLRVFGKIFIRPIFGLELRGKENLPDDNGFILCANHWSILISKTFLSTIEEDKFKIAGPVKKFLLTNTDPF